MTLSDELQTSDCVCLCSLTSSLCLSFLFTTDTRDTTGLVTRPEPGPPPARPARQPGDSGAAGHGMYFTVTIPRMKLDIKHRTPPLADSFNDTELLLNFGTME